MKIVTDHREGLTVFKLSGRLTLEEVSGLDKVTRELAAVGHNRCVINMLDIRDLSSSGLGAIFRLKKTLDAKGGALALSTLSAVAEYVLDLARLKDVFNTFPTDDAAIAFLLSAKTP